MDYFSPYNTSKYKNHVIVSLRHYPRVSDQFNSSLKPGFLPDLV